MASSSIYPPVLKQKLPAFMTNSNNNTILEIPFEVSDLGIPVNLSNILVHVAIWRKDGISVLDRRNGENRYRATGIILDVPVNIDNNINYIIINSNDLASHVTFNNGDIFNGFIPGWEYKVQLRFSTESYEEYLRNHANTKQETWLQIMSDYFSEWSSFCYVKCIGPIQLSIPSLDGYSYIFNDNNSGIIPISPASSLEIKNIDHELSLKGSLESVYSEANEYYESCRFKIYDAETDELIEDTKDIYPTEASYSSFEYKLKSHFENNKIYRMEFSFITENGYSNGINNILFEQDIYIDPPVDIHITTIDTNYQGLLTDITTIDMEEDEGRIGLKLWSNSEEPYFGSLCIRRASQKDNFQTWEDVKIISLKNEMVNDYPIIYDYLIESGVWYKYGVQSIDSDWIRGELVEMNNPVQRLFNYSFLLGEDGQQLKLAFDNTMDSFENKRIDSKIEPIGSKYPYISRNGVVNYKAFPIKGLISFWMDDNKTFLENGRNDLYKYADVIEKYKEFNEERNILQRDFTLERDFRKVVLEFLENGKPKLFKSPTEGNIIVRLIDVKCNPNKTLDRLVYSFSCNANEIAEANIENYSKYNYYKVGEPEQELSIINYHIGQLNGDFGQQDNIIEMIQNKYNIYADTSESIVTDIYGLKITSNSPSFNDEGIEIYFWLRGGMKQGFRAISKTNVFDFGETTKFSNSSLYINGANDSINATIDFIYGLTTRKIKQRVISIGNKDTQIKTNIGQYIEIMTPGTSIYNSIAKKYNQRFELWDDKMTTRLKSISSIDIFAEPHTVFAIKDAYDGQVEYHEINDTGRLTLYELTEIAELTYIGKRYLESGYDDSSLSENIITTDVTKKDIYGNDITIKAAADVMINYIYTLEITTEIIK